MTETAHEPGNFCHEAAIMTETANEAGNFCHEAAIMLSLKKQRDVGFSEGVSYTALSRKWRRGQIKRWL
jgi:hypothetical protein